MKKTKFSLRKSAYGLVSVAIAILGVSTLANSSFVSADEVSNAETVTTPSSETSVIPHGFVSELDDSLPEFTAKVTSQGSDGLSVVSNGVSTITKEKVDTVISYNVPDTVTVTDVHNNIYTEDSTSDNSSPVLKQEGQDGVSTKDVLSYKVNESDTDPTITDVTYSEPKVITEKKDAIYAVGTKPTVETTETNYITKYQSDDNLDFGKEVTVQEGKVGKIVKTTTYKVNSSTGERLSLSENSETPSVVKIVAKGTKPTVEKSAIPFKVQYIFDESKPYSYSNTVQGSDGYSLVKTTYQVDKDTGVVSVLNKETSVTNPLDTLITKGTAKNLSYYSIDYKVKEVEDSTLPKGTTKVSVKGVKGKGLLTTTYVGNTNTGEVSSTSIDSVVEEPITEIVLVGVGVSTSDEIKKDEIKKDETSKPSDEVKKDETSKPSDEVKKDETSKPSDEVKKDETSKPSDEVKKDETSKPSDEVKKDEIKKDETSKPTDEVKKDEVKKDETSKPVVEPTKPVVEPTKPVDEVKKDEISKPTDEIKKDGTSKPSDEVKKDEVTKDEVKKDEISKPTDEVKKDETSKPVDEMKKDETSKPVVDALVYSSVSPKSNTRSVSPGNKDSLPETAVSDGVLMSMVGGILLSSSAVLVRKNKK